ncbi:hypothetical protein DAPPUDRAFT_321458 [Daphnia pulex]|uniref:DEAD/DEAH box helicase domain-containing protein n=1 Tax=Daphnia pulex TaxID=6669 RepID=E9GT92_DAPPU|nr:hypothetical protein DAPPUDRAFT_321458 [Daphnia pulex]|eukprot:EFX77236.1 hypothetical protein DAPPUDRAFT_321458 [Daphnia pulex]
MDDDDDVLSVDSWLSHFDKFLPEEKWTMASIIDLFGFSILKTQKSEVIDAVLAGKDCLAVMPTDGGKSACYFIPGSLQQGVTLVVKAISDILESEANLMQFFTSNTRHGSGVKFMFFTPEKVCNALKDQDNHNKLKMC